MFCTSLPAGHTHHATDISLLDTENLQLPVLLSGTHFQTSSESAFWQSLKTFFLHQHQCVQCIQGVYDNELYKWATFNLLTYIRHQYAVSGTIAKKLQHLDHTACRHMKRDKQAPMTCRHMYTYRHTAAHKIFRDRIMLQCSHYYQGQF